MATAPPQKLSLLRRFTFDSEGELRGGRLLAITASLAMFISIGAMVVVYLTNAVSPSAMAWWTAGMFVAIKLPMMAFFWWLLGTRNPNDNTMSTDEARRMLVHLRQRSLATTHYSDASERFEAQIAEVNYLALHGPTEVRREAEVLKREIEERRSSLTATPA